MNIKLEIELPSKFVRNEPQQMKAWLFEASKRKGTSPPYLRLMGLTITPDITGRNVGAQIRWGWF